MTLLTLVFMTVEIIGGWIANSIAIMSDAAHLLSDVVGIGFSIVGLCIATRHATEKYSWGYHRAEVFGALLSIFSIWIITIFLVVEAIHRFFIHPEVKGKMMFIISFIALAFNLIMMKILHSGDGHMHGPAHGQCSHGHDHGHDHAHDHDHDHDSDDEESQPVLLQTTPPEENKSVDLLTDTSDIMHNAKPLNESTFRSTLRSSNRLTDSAHTHDRSCDHSHDHTHDHDHSHAHDHHHSVDNDSVLSTEDS